MAERTTRSPIFAIPDDPELSAYRFIIVAAKRAAAVAKRRPLVPAQHVEKADRGGNGRGAARFGELVRPRRATARATGRRAALTAETGLPCPGYPQF